MIKIVAITIFVFSFQHLSAQTTTDSVQKAVELLFTAMHKSDTFLLRQSFTPAPILQTITKNKDGQIIVADETLDAFATSISSYLPGSLDERITIGAIHIDGPLATVWTPYQFYFNGNFIHCGVNSFQLVRLNGIWKIQYIIDTRRSSNCD